MLPLFSIKFYVQRIQSLIIKRQYLKLPSSFDNSTTEQNYKIANTSIYTFFRVSFLSTHKDQRFHTPASPRKGIYFLFSLSVVKYATILCELHVTNFVKLLPPQLHISQVLFLSTHKDERLLLQHPQPSQPAGPRKGIYFLFTSSVGCGRINYSTIFCELRVNSFFVAYLPFFSAEIGLSLRIYVMNKDFKVRVVCIWKQPNFIKLLALAIR